MEGVTADQERHLIPVKYVSTSAPEGKERERWDPRSTRSSPSLVRP